jgi:hypothetical protein
MPRILNTLQPVETMIQQLKCMLQYKVTEDLLCEMDEEVGIHHGSWHASSHHLLMLRTTWTLQMGKKCTSIFDKETSWKVDNQSKNLTDIR